MSDRPVQTVYGIRETRILVSAHGCANWPGQPHARRAESCCGGETTGDVGAWPGSTGVAEARSSQSWRPCGWIRQQ